MVESARLHVQNLPSTSYGLEQDSAEDAVELKDVIESVGWRWFHMRLLALTWIFQVAPAAIIGAVPFVLRHVREEYHVSMSFVSAISSATMVGSAIGTILFGWLNDVWGRKRSCLLASLGMGLLCALHLALPRAHLSNGAANADFALLVALRFGIGIFFAGAAGTLTQLLLSEFLPSRFRGTVLTCGNAGWSFGTIYVLLILRAFDDNWRLILAAPTLVAAVAFALFFHCSESMRWLFVMGREEEGRVVLGSVVASQVLLATPGTESDHQVVPRRIVVTRNDQRSKKVMDTSLGKNLSKLFEREYRVLTLCSISLQVSLNAASYISSVWFPEVIQKLMNVPTMPYTLFIYCEILGWISVFLVAYLLDAWGRRPTLIGLFALTTLLIFSFEVVPPTYEWLAMVYLLQSMCINGLWPAMTAYLGECFPTSIRGVANSLGGVCGRIASVVGPLICGFLLDRSASSSHPYRPVVMLSAGLFAMGCVGAYFIPCETANASMEDV
eukprot:TRINITY_DN3717_c0_g5_i1.p1 TRINITY_DN3717_c0_g5~~TRINITY_DN3717_c0_g5_i1.p1  ORF type:complete len:515 (-),score=46.31 TRINITY_DN3717_c0_g5_i1:83-1579(-)